MGSPGLLPVRDRAGVAVGVGGCPLVGLCLGSTGKARAPLDLGRSLSTCHFGIFSPWGEVKTESTSELRLEA